MKTMKKHVLYLLLFCTVPSYAQLALYSFVGTVGDEISASSTDTDLNSTAFPLRRGSGVIATTKANVFASRSWVATQLDTTKYLMFSIAPSTNYGLELGGLTFSIERSSTGPTSYSVTSLINGVETQVGMGTLSGTTQNLQLNLSIQTVNPILFKIYAWGASSSVGTFHLRNQLSLTGTSPLPVKWRFFTAQQKSELAGVLLQWETAEEDNVQYFAVEKSTNAKDFTSIHIENPRGQGGAGATYSFVDILPNKETTYYRLKAVDWTKEVAFSTLRTVNRNYIPLDEVLIYPNPTQDIVTLAENRFVAAQILNQNGQVVLKESWPKSLSQISMKHLPDGKYYLQLQSKNGEITHEIIYKAN